MISADDYSAIVQLIQRYAHAVDRRDWNAVHSCLEPDAVADYGAGPIVGSAAIVAEIERVESRFLATHHFLAAPLVTSEGTVVRASSYAIATHVSGSGGASTYFRVGSRYDDVLGRGGEGWRISRRSAEIFWSEGSSPVTAYPG
jgi:ketosteroid isomerase-like protein